MNKRYIIFLLAIILCQSNLYAENKVIAINPDSLWNAAVEHGRHGRFDESNAIVYYFCLLK